MGSAWQLSVTRQLTLTVDSLTHPLVQDGVEEEEEEDAKQREEEQVGGVCMHTFTASIYCFYYHSLVSVHYTCVTVSYAKPD